MGGAVVVAVVARVKRCWRAVERALACVRARTWHTPHTQQQRRHAPVRQQVVHLCVGDALVVGARHDVARRLVQHEAQRPAGVERLAVEQHLWGGGGSWWMGCCWSAL